MDPETKAFFLRMKSEDRENNKCVDCTSPNPQWASVSYGTYFCLMCSGVHRSLGVHISFVRSTTMDTWDQKQLKKMEAGGNSKFKAFLEAHGINEKTHPTLQAKYSTKACEFYRSLISYLADPDRVPRPVDLQPGEGAKAAYKTNTTVSGNNFGSMSSSSSNNYPNLNSSSVNNSFNQGRSESWDPDDPLGSFLSGAASKAMGLGGWVKEKAKDTIEKAKDEGWLETIHSGVTQAGSFVVDKSKVVLEKVNEDGLVDKVKFAAKDAVYKARDAGDWFSEQIIGRPIIGSNGTESRGDRAARSLQGLSTGQMQGFGSDCPPPQVGHQHHHSSSAKHNTTASFHGSHSHRSGSIKHSTDSDLLNMGSNHSRERSRSPPPPSPRHARQTPPKTSEEDVKPAPKKPVVNKLNINEDDDWENW